MKIKYIGAVIFIAALVIIVGLLVNEERRNAEGNFREGVTFANLEEVGENLTIDGVSLTFEGETRVNCSDYPQDKQEECRELKFFAFKIRESEIPLKAYQGYTGAYIVLKGTPSYERVINMTMVRNTIIFSATSDLYVESPQGFYEVKYAGNSFKNVTSFKIETIFKKS